MLQSYPMYAYIPARDIARARKFYEGKLGLKPLEQQIDGGVAYEFSDNTAAFLYDAGDSAGTNKASQAFWDVKDVDRTVAALRERGVVFEKYDDIPGKRTCDGYVVEAGGAKAAWFKDPDGNILAVIQYVG